MCIFFIISQSSESVLSGCMWLCKGGWRDCYFVLNSLMACGVKVLWNLTVLLPRQSLFIFLYC